MKDFKNYVFAKLYCLHYYSSSEKLEIYNVDCREMNDRAIELSNDDK